MKKQLLAGFLLSCVPLVSAAQFYPYYGPGTPQANDYYRGYAHGAANAASNLQYGNSAFMNGYIVTVQPPAPVYVQPAPPVYVQPAPPVYVQPPVQVYVYPDSPPKHSHSHPHKHR